MYMKAKYRCSCGCVSEFDNNTSATSIVCPNCGSKLQADISDKVLLLLRTMNEIPEPNAFSSEAALAFVTSPWADMPKNQG